MYTFEEVFVDDTRNGTKLKSDEYCLEGRHVIIDQGQNNIAGYTNWEEGLYIDVPAIIFGDHTRVVKYVDRPFFLGADGVKVLKCKLEGANYKYLYYMLKNVRLPDTGYNRHFKWLKEIEFSYPQKNTQDAVVIILDKVQGIINLREQEIKELDNLIKSRFVEMFGEPELNSKNYPVMLLSEIAEYWNGLTYKPEDVADEGTIVLRSSNIQNSQLDFEDTVRVSCFINEKKYVQDNDILMCSRNGSARLVGKVALIKSVKEPMSFGAFMMIIRSEYYQYLMTYFQMDAFRNQITTGATTTINQITGKMLDAIKLPVPDICEVNQFAECVKGIDKLKSEVQQSLDEMQLLMDSLMQKYFG